MAFISSWSNSCHRRFARNRFRHATGSSPWRAARFTRSARSRISVRSCDVVAVATSAASAEGSSTAAAEMTSASPTDSSPRRERISRRRTRPQPLGRLDRLLGLTPGRAVGPGQPVLRRRRPLRVAVALRRPGRQQRLDGVELADHHRQPLDPRRRLSARQQRPDRSARTTTRPPRTTSASDGLTAVEGAELVTSSPYTNSVRLQGKPLKYQEISQRSDIRTHRPTTCSAAMFGVPDAVTRRLPVDDARPPRRAQVGRAMTVTDGHDGGDRRVAVITGGARGIGAATGLRLARKGWKVALIDAADGSETLGYGLATVADLERSVAACGRRRSGCWPTCAPAGRPRSGRHRGGRWLGRRRGGGGWGHRGRARHLAHRRRESGTP